MGRKNILLALCALKNIVFVEKKIMSLSAALRSEKKNLTSKPPPPLSEMDVPLLLALVIPFVRTQSGTIAIRCYFPYINKDYVLPYTRLNLSFYT